MHQVALIRGDGIGPEIGDATVRVIEASGARIDWEETLIGQEARRRFGAELPWDSIERIRALGVALKAPLIAEKASGGVVVEGGGPARRHPSINNGLRRELDAFANLRPVRGYAGVSGPYPNLDLVIVRELTEDVYAEAEGRGQVQVIQTIAAAHDCLLIGLIRKAEARADVRISLIAMAARHIVHTRVNQSASQA